MNINTNVDQRGLRKQDSYPCEAQPQLSEMREKTTTWHHQLYNVNYISYNHAIL